MNHAGWATGAVAVLSFGFATGPARADDDIAAMRARLDQIKQLVADFDARLNALEAARSSATQPRHSAATASTAVGLAPASAPAPAPAAVPVPISAPAPVVQPPTSATQPAAANAPVVVPRAQWRRVQSGLTMDEVNSLIGAPTKTFELAGKTVWYYYYPAIGAGSVFFDAHGRASSVQRPAGGSW